MCDVQKLPLCFIDKKGRSTCAIIKSDTGPNSPLKNQCLLQNVIEKELINLYKSQADLGFW